MNKANINKASAFAAYKIGMLLKPITIDRRTPLAKDVQIDILYCGVCHSDLHSVNGDWGGKNFPLVPGHEIVGKVNAVGSEVKNFKIGDAVGVGCFVNSCRTCPACHEGLQQYCEQGATMTYGSADKFATGAEGDATGATADGAESGDANACSYTQGGYSTQIVVDQDFVLKIPSSIPLDRAAPLLCAGITTYSPLRHWKVKKGDKVGVAGLGGLGHMAVKIAAAMGAEVTVISTSEAKRADAEKLGAHKFAVSKDLEQMRSLAGNFDLILDTISAAHDYNLYLSLLKRDGSMVLLGLPAPQSVSAQPLIHKRRKLAGSLVGGIPETQEMLNFCAEHNLAADVEVIPMQEINTAYQRMVKGDVHYRFVIDMKSLK